LKGADTGRRIEVEVEPSQLRERLRRALEEGYDHFIGINVVDYPRAGVMEVYYFVESVQRGGELLVVKLRVPRENPALDSVSDIYPLAEYQEIEAHEFFGLDFRGNGSLRKWILDENWEGPPPLRKDVDTRKFVLETYYGGQRYERPKQEKSLQEVVE